MAQHSSYLSTVFKSSISFQGTVNTAVKRLQKLRRRKGYQFDAIFCRGVSGICVAAPIAYRLKCGLIVIRKEQERQYSHADCLVEGACDSFRSLLFVDDFTSSGNTLVACLKQLKETYSSFGQKLPSLVGSYFYHVHRQGFEDNETMIAGLYQENRKEVAKLLTE